MAIVIPGDEEFPVRVVGCRWEAAGVVSLRLERPDGGTLPPWEPGAHVELTLPSGRIRHYSLCGPREDPHGYTIAVLREPSGRGGSAEIHDTGLVGRELRIRGPRNNFPLRPASSYVLVAGGIGITPILSMARELAARGSAWRLYYGGRSLRSMSFLPAVDSLAGSAAAPVEVRAEDESGLLAIADIVADAPAGAAIYACGPAGLLEALRSATGSRGGDLEVHFEVFTAPVPGEDGEIEAGRHERPFTVVLAQSGETVRVTDGTTILEAVREVVPEVPYSCEEGFCGTCVTKVISGSPVHRDTVLSAEDHAAGDTMTICVGSSASAELVLDL
ncbi:PDR/VanB family oxidoreductase [Amycolatopsis rhabdoformis]|uniref:PDR/VanB family oxidoreductase n=1 Tax=Amycolatopsis rhabdoformis TaxID=1448059 RepID=A0ABZ1ICN5_9PSEU|nr:PDR/VanB family oxidoreductase [Amycolatopsis rhabdoformis]WSE32219.1 PDR/VanB family oxidoreductase [Amycolatopsis rhabdoformis]